MSTKKPDHAKPLPEPQAGGRYERNEDGSLRRVHETKPHQGGRTQASKDEAKRRADEARQADVAPQPATKE